MSVVYSVPSLGCSAVWSSTTVTGCTPVSTCAPTSVYIASSPLPTLPIVTSGCSTITVPVSTFVPTVQCGYTSTVHHGLTMPTSRRAETAAAVSNLQLQIVRMAGRYFGIDTQSLTFEEVLTQLMGILGSEGGGQVPTWILDLLLRFITQLQQQTPAPQVPAPTFSAAHVHQESPYQRSVTSQLEETLHDLLRYRAR